MTTFLVSLTTLRTSGTRSRPANGIVRRLASPFSAVITKRTNRARVAASSSDEARGVRPSPAATIVARRARASSRESEVTSRYIRTSALRQRAPTSPEAASLKGAGSVKWSESSG